MNKLSIILNFGKMKKVSNKEIRDIAKNIVNKTSNSSSDNAIEDVDSMLREIFEKMEIAVEKIKNNPNCKCTDCECKK